MSLIGLVAAVAAVTAPSERANLAEACPGEPNGGWEGASDEVLRNHIWERRQEAPAVCLYMGAVHWSKTDAPRALRLHLLGMVRSQYEHGLCRDWPRNEASSFHMAMQGISGEALRATGPFTPDEAKEALREVAGPADVLTYEPVMIEQLCGRGGLQPREEWPGVAAKLLDEVRTTVE